MKTGVNGLEIHSAYFNAETQAELLLFLREAVVQAPLFQPVMPRSGRPFSVRMTNFGVKGWVSDRHGYRYQPCHPVTGEPWPPIPALLIDLWNKVAGYHAPPEACLVNYYGAGAKMGLHQDSNEEALDAPVVSLSLGDTALFRIGGAAKGGITRGFKLASGDVLVMGGAARLAYHGIAKIYSGTSSLLKDGGRINLTLRRVSMPHKA